MANLDASAQASTKFGEGHKVDAALTATVPTKQVLTIEEAGRLSGLGGGRPQPHAGSTRKGQGPASARSMRRRHIPRSSRFGTRHGRSNRARNELSSCATI